MTNTIVNFSLLFGGLLICNLSFGQCQIADFTISYCANEAFIDLTEFEPIPNGTYSYSELGTPIPNPETYPTNGNTEITGIFLEATGCQDTFLITLVETPIPVLTVLSDTILDCLVSQITIHLQISPPGNYSFQWSGPGITFPNQQDVTVEFPGVYTVEVLDPASNCIVSREIIITQDLDFPSIEIEAMQNCDGTVSIAALATEPDAPYLYSWRGNGIISNPNSPSILVDTTGEFEILVSDSISQCVISEFYTVDSIGCQTNSEYNLSSLNQIEVFPNPVRDLLYFKHTRFRGEYLITSSRGEIILRSKNQKSFIDLSHLAAGLYFLFTIEDGVIIAHQRIQKI